MSESIVITPVNHVFNIQVLVREAIEREGDQTDDDEAPGSSCPPSDGDSALSSLTPSPDLSPSATANALPSLLFLDPSDALSSVASPKKQRQKKKTDKVTPKNRQARKTAAGNAARKERRAREVESAPGRVKTRLQARLKQLGKAKAITCDHYLNSLDLPAASTGYVGQGDGSSCQKSFTLAELVGKSSKYKFQLEEWDGSYSAGLVDGENRVIGILAGYPDDKGYPIEKRWPFLQRQAIKAFETFRAQCWIPKERRRGHRRGNFVTLNSGVSYGGGQKVPGNLRNEPANERVLSEMNSLPAFKRLAGFVSSVLGSWAPKLYKYYETMTDRLHEHHPDLKKIFPESIFSAVSYNFGPRTVCHPHTDPGNLAFGACAVTPVGDFDYKNGGHLILWNLRLVIEFPPGTTIIFPSAVITHSNVAISKDETRYSFAQYTAGGLFRWVDQGFRTKEEQMASLSPAELEKEKARLEGMWEFGISLLPIATTIHDAKK